MIRDPVGIVAVLLLIEGAIFFLSELPAVRRVFTVLPEMFWIYFLPMVANTAGLVPHQSEVYGVISPNVMPACLVLLMVSVDLRAILRLGRSALAMMLVGSAAIVLGGPLVLLVFGRWLPKDAWMGIGALSASWTGGSANMVAVKHAFEVPEDIYLPMVVVDSIIPYLWMAALMAMSAWQARFDRWNRCDTGVMEDLGRRVWASEPARAQPLALRDLATLMAVAAASALSVPRLARLLPEI